MEKLFARGKLEDIEQRKRFVSKLCPKIRKLYVMRGYASMDELLATALEVKRILVELGETPYELLKEE